MGPHAHTELQINKEHFMPNYRFLINLDVFHPFYHSHAQVLASLGLEKIDTNLLVFAWVLNADENHLWDCCWVILFD
jgi:hypothetical protein